ncbi:SDR family oxidoreductase [Occallatibacter riparius]|uniref:SDR family oxidoreductase n=1 Tax=Occallatibacter riparius TaxID=1002689 RepID=A0A9J7BH47_9BACT|nr:SDR family oxidoreductase [Occallatibacter riparius]UWZ81841.1 SDR family oxidoreductase [Occallatibacter riparius]
MNNSPHDPREAGPKPPFPQQPQAHPGSVRKMNPAADHGEESYRGTGKLNGRVAIITGGDSGIGRAVAIAFSREGADVVISFLPEEQADADDTASAIECGGGRVLKVPGDLQQLDYIKQLVSKTIDKFGHLDIIVNNAGYQMSHGDIEELSPEELDHTFRTNVFATFLLSQTALKHLQPGGVILNTTSIQAYDPSPQLTVYAATKAAILSLTKSIAGLAMKKGVRVNAVAPGPVWTPLIPSTMPEEKVKEFGCNTDFGRPAQPVELAKVFVFLASDDASYVTGEVYGATGGRTPY